MAKYIDVDTIEYHEIFEGHEFVRVAYGDDIDELPTADVVEVVRCKDCKHWEVRDGWDNCTFFDWLMEDGNGFCHFGERREDEIQGKK